MSIVIEDGPELIGTHALVIGIGRYPHLKGGDADDFPHHEEMGQLASPPLSAARFSEWLRRDYNNPQKPLRSLDVLISGPTSRYPELGDIDVEPATIANIKQAVRRWYAKGMHHKQNQLVFFFCGHGVSSGEEQSLLAQDFGADALSPFEHAISFGDFLTGMRNCRAGQQVYFVDACRTVSEEYLRRYSFTGWPLVDGVPSRNLGKVQQPVISATDLGSLAYGERENASFFTRALLRALEGSGSIELEDGWAVCSDVLVLGINAHLARYIAAYGREQVAMQTHPSKRIEIHYLLNAPLIPVDVRCKPGDYTAEANLECARNGSVVHRRPPGGAKVWEVELGPGEYEFRAQFPDNRCSPQPRTRTVYPPGQRVRIDCA